MSLIILDPEWNKDKDKEDSQELQAAYDEAAMQEHLRALDKERAEMEDDDL